MAGASGTEAYGVHVTAYRSPAIGDAIGEMVTTKGLSRNHRYRFLLQPSMARAELIISLAIWMLLQILTQAAPLTVKRSSQPSVIQETDINRLRVPATFAADAYCTSLQNGSKVGEDGTVIWKMGDGNHLQMVYLAYSPTLGIVVAHQGTNRSSAASLDNDLKINKVPRDARLTSLPAGAQVADGFQDAWLDTAEDVLGQIRLARETYPEANLTFTGHSLGAAISLFDALYAKQSLNATVNVVLLGLPRVGDAKFANAVDTILDGQTHIIHADDPIPHLPFRSWGFQHPSGEVWIPAKASDDQALVCPGQENAQCADSVKVVDYSLKDHSGPYFGVMMDCGQTP